MDTCSTYAKLCLVYQELTKYCCIFIHKWARQNKQTPDGTGEVLTVNTIKLFSKQQRTQKQRLISLKNITLKLVTMCPNLFLSRDIIGDRITLQNKNTLFAPPPNCCHRYQMKCIMDNTMCAFIM